MKYQRDDWQLFVDWTQLPVFSSTELNSNSEVLIVPFTKKNECFSLSFIDGKPMLRQGDTGDWVGTFEGHKGAVWGVALNRNATLAASGAADFSGKHQNIRIVNFNLFFTSFFLSIFA